MRLNTADLFTRGHTQQAVGIHRERDADARRACGHGRNAAQLKPRQAAAICHQITLALHHMQRQRGLAVNVGGEILRLGSWDGFVAQDNALRQATHGLNTK